MRQPPCAHSHHQGFAGSVFAIAKIAASTAWRPPGSGLLRQCSEWVEGLAFHADRRSVCRLEGTGSNGSNSIDQAGR